MSAPSHSSYAPASSAPESGLKIWSCVICRRRKVKCDRRDPCSNCTKANIECHYPVTGRIPRRGRDPLAWKSPAQKQSELLSRLRRLEAVVTELAGQVEDGSGTSSANSAPTQASSLNGGTSSPDAIRSDGRSAIQSFSGSASEAPSVKAPAGSEFDEEFGRLVVDKDGGLHVGNRFWSVFCDEVDHIFEAIHDVVDSSDKIDPSVSGAAPSDSFGNQGFVFGNSATLSSLDGFKPLPSQMLFIWQTYVDNVDPFLKILHVPTMDKIIRELKGSITSLGPSMESLLFAICLAAIMSMDDESVSLNFNISKTQLLAQYRRGTEQALGQADFLVTKEIVVIQAFVIYLTTLTYLGSNELVWSLTGSLLRIAKSLGLHRNNGAPNGSAVDVELRCRLWWHICFLDSKSRKPGARDLSLLDSSFDTKLPSGLDDTDLSSDPKHLSTASRLSTKLIPCLVRCELWRLVQSQQASSAKSLQVKLQTYYATRKRIEEIYLGHLRHEIAFERYLKTMGSLFFAKAELVIHKSSSQSNSQASVNAALKASIMIINDSHALITDPTWAQWRWQLAGQVPWHAIGIFLGQACRQHWGPESEQVWLLTKRLLEAASMESKEDQLWAPLMKLIEKTEKHREAESTRSATNTTQGQIATALPITQQWATRANPDPETSLLYPPNNLTHLVAQPQASYVQFTPLSETSGLVDQRENIEPLRKVIEFSGQGLHSQSIDPTLWSPTVDPGGFGAGSLTETVPPDELIPAAWDSWGGALGGEAIWDLF